MESSLIKSRTSISIIHKNESETDCRFWNKHAGIEVVHNKNE